MHHDDHLFQGWLRSTYDALLVFEAARRGIIPRVTRRFHDIEKRNIIQSGSIFVYTEEESSIKRWTDPFLWSASRMLGNFLIYRERHDEEVRGSTPYMCFPLEAKNEAIVVVDPLQERDIYGSWNRGKGLKEDGMMKKTMSLTVKQITYHLVAYYLPSDVRSGKLQTPSETQRLSSLKLSPEMVSDLSQFRQPPIIEIERNGTVRYIADRDEKNSASDLSLPLFYKMLSTPEPAPSPVLYTPLSDVPYRIGADEHNVYTPSPSPNYGSLHSLDAMSSASSPIGDCQVLTQGYHLGDSISHRPGPYLFEEWRSCAPQSYRFQSNTESWQYTFESQTQTFLDPFRLAYNSPVFWDISWGGPDCTENSWNYSPN